MSPPKDGDIRVCYLLTLLEDHAVVIDVPSVPVAKIVHDALMVVHLTQLDHSLHNQPASVVVQSFSDERGWTEVPDLNLEI